MVYCPKCGRKNPNDADICAYCGAQIHAGKYPNWDTVNEREQDSKRKAQEERDKNIRQLAAIAFVVIVIVVGAAFFASILTENGGQSSDYWNDGNNDNDYEHFTDEDWVDMIEETLATYDIEIKYSTISDGRDEGGERALILGYESEETTYWTEDYTPEALDMEIARFVGAFQGAVKRENGLDVDIMEVVVGDEYGNGVGMWYCYTDWAIKYDKGLLTTQELYQKIWDGMTVFR